MLEHFYLQLSSLFPRKTVNQANALIVQGGFKNLTARRYLGFSLVFSLSAGLLAFFLSSLFVRDPLMQVGAAAAFFAAAAFLFYVLLVSAAENRARQIESVLPNSLEIISANIRAGMTLENAIWSAARPEFGALSDEIKHVAAESFGGTTVRDSFAKMTRRVRSQTVERAVKLINEGIALGGTMAPLLSEVAQDVRNTQLLQKEIATTTVAYSMFIAFAAVIACPLLFSVSSYYAEMNENVLEKQQGAQIDERVLQQAGGISAVAGLGKAKVGPGITAEDTRLFSLASISLTAFFAALTTGLIRFGSALRGLKYAPPFIAVSIGIFLLSSSVLSTAFSTLLQ